MTTQSYATRIGSLTFTHDFASGYATYETVKQFFDELDFQHACQAYLWALPIVSFAQWQYEHTVTLGAKNGQIVFVESYEDKLGGLLFDLGSYAVSVFVARLPRLEASGS